MIFGMATLVGLYLAMTLAYHYVLPMAEIAAADAPSGGIEKAVAAVYCKSLLGRNGVLAISALVMCSTKFRGERIFSLISGDRVPK